MKTVSYDETQWKLVPIEPTVEMKLSCVYMQVHSAIEEEWTNMLAAAPPYQSENVLNMVWIPVSERLPEIGIEILAFRPQAKESQDSKLTFTFLTNNAHESPQGVVHRFECWCHVSHWMPLPSAPKGEE